MEKLRNFSFDFSGEIPNILYILNVILIFLLIVGFLKQFSV